MKTPKIGDIVHVNFMTIYPAVILNIDEDFSCNLYLFGMDSTYAKQHLKYSPESKKNHWSWPEEEKQCEHDYREICLPVIPTIYQKKCFKCGDVKEENKAEELIGKIDSTMNRNYNSHLTTDNLINIMRTHLKEISDLIKEYKEQK